MNNETDYKRIFLAIFLAAVALMYWQYKVEWPRRQALAKLNAQVEHQHAGEQEKYAQQSPGTPETDDNAALTHEQRIAGSPRVIINTDTVKGSIALKGVRFDDLTLEKYRETIDKDSSDVTLLYPAGEDHAYFSQIGWLPGDGKTKVPDQNSLWQADKKSIKAGDIVTLKWDNGDKVTFVLTVSFDDHYMFSIAQKVENHSGSEISVLPYAYINRTYELPKQAGYLHEGPIGVMDGTLNEVKYKELQEKGNKVYDNTSGWFGFTDKYWLTSLIPSGEHNKITFSYYSKNNRERYQVDYLGENMKIAPGSDAENNVRFFAGAKELKTLDNYTYGTDKSPAIPLFDRGLDFGWFYFLAKPASWFVTFLYHLTGNFGVALLIFIMVVKLAMFPLLAKSNKSMAQMRDLQPEIVKLRERYADDQIAMHKATRELYKREKINPAAGCLPILIQIVVFLALFRGLNVTIEMRQAPFYGWIKDLSAADPSNLFNGFGLLNLDLPGWLHLGLLPMLYCATMVVQTKLQPKPADPVQAKMMGFMPYMMLLFFDKMAAGFVLYWTWSNILSIVQMRFFTKRNKNASAKPKAA